MFPEVHDCKGFSLLLANVILKSEGFSNVCHRFPFLCNGVFVGWRHNLNKNALMPVSVILMLHHTKYIFVWYMPYKTNALITTVMWSCCA